MLIVFIVLLPLWGCCSASTTHFSDSSFFYAPLHVAYDLDIVMIGLEGDGAASYRLDTEALRSLLVSSMAFRDIHDLASGYRLFLQYQVNFHLHHISDLGLPAQAGQHLQRYQRLLEDAYAASPVYRGAQVESDVRYVSIDAVTPFFDELMSSISRGLQTIRHTIFVVNPAFDPAKKYAYYLGNSVPTQAWVSAGRYIVVDLSAGPCVHGSLDASVAALSLRSVPRVPRLVEPALSALVVSALQHVLLPDIMDARNTPEDMLLIPLLVFRNHEAFQSIPSVEAEYDLDVMTIQRELMSLANPDTSNSLVLGIHSLHEHKHVAMALSNSIHAKSVHHLISKSQYEVRFLTEVVGERLLDQLSKSTDSLTKDLLEQHGTAKMDAIKNAYFGSGLGRPANIRIYPVYVFSLKGKPKGFFFEHGECLYANNHGAVIIQTNWTNVEVPYFYDRVKLHVNQAESTRLVIEAVVRGVANVSPFHLKWSSKHNKTLTNWFWSVGATAGSPLCESTVVSQITRDNAVHNGVIVRVDQAMRTAQRVLKEIRHFESLFVWNPSGVNVEHDEQSDELARSIAMLKDQLDPLRDALTSIADAFEMNDQKRALLLASTLPTLSDQLLEFTTKTLQQLKTDLYCCNMRHHIPRAVPVGTFAILIIVLALATITILQILKK